MGASRQHEFSGRRECTIPWRRSGGSRGSSGARTAASRLGTEQHRHRIDPLAEQEDDRPIGSLAAPRRHRYVVRPGGESRVRDRRFPGLDHDAFTEPLGERGECAGNRVPLNDESQHTRDPRFRSHGPQGSLNHACHIRCDPRRLTEKPTTNGRIVCLASLRGMHARSRDPQRSVVDGTGAPPRAGRRRGRRRRHHRGRCGAGRRPRRAR